MTKHARVLLAQAFLTVVMAMPMSASADMEPDPFDLGWFFGAHRDALAYSNVVTVTGIDEPVGIGISWTTTTTVNVGGVATAFTSRTIDRRVLTSGRLQDMNGDGYADMLWRNDASGDAKLWLLDDYFPNAHGVQWEFGLLGGRVDWAMTQVGDLDGDGHDDLVWSGPNQQVALYLMDGTLRRAGTGLPAGTGSPVAIADFDADGKADLLIRTTQGIERYRMDGLTVLGTALELDLAKTLLRATDFNGDGRADVAYDDSAATPAGLYLRYSPSLLPVTGPNPQPVSSDPAWKLQ